MNERAAMRHLGNPSNTPVAASRWRTEVMAAAPARFASRRIGLAAQGLGDRGHYGPERPWLRKIGDDFPDLGLESGQSRRNGPVGDVEGSKGGRNETGKRHVKTMTGAVLLGPCQEHRACHAVLPAAVHRRIALGEVAQGRSRALPVRADVLHHRSASRIGCSRCRRAGADIEAPWPARSWRFACRGPRSSSLAVGGSGGGPKGGGGSAQDGSPPVVKPYRKSIRAPATLSWRCRRRSGSSPSASVHQPQRPGSRSVQVPGADRGIFGQDLQLHLLVVPAQDKVKLRRSDPLR